MTKSLKLLYIIDETSIRETGVPLTWLDFKVWKNGPVAIDIYNEIRHEEIICIKGKELSISPYVSLDIKFNEQNEKETYLLPKAEFKRNIFNLYELELLDRTVQKFGYWSVDKIIDYLHQEKSLWSKVVKEHNLESVFTDSNYRTNYSIEFSELIENDPILLMANQASREALEFQERLLG